MRLQGIVPPIATPLDSEERVDEPALKRLVQGLLSARVNGVFVLGSTGEFAHLTDKEKRRALEIVVSEVNKKVPVLAGVTETSTRRSLQWVKEAERSGADFLVAAPPFYYPLTEDELERHYRLLAEEAGLPVLLYHIPATTKVRFSLPLLERLAEVPQIVGIKDSSGDLPFVFALIDALKQRPFLVFQGHDALLAPALLYGADGGINSLSNLVPEWFVALYQAAQRKDVGEAFAWQQRLNALMKPLEAFPFLPALKEALHLRWGIPAMVTAPFAPLTEEQKSLLRAILIEAGVPTEMS